MNNIDNPAILEYFAPVRAWEDRGGRGTLEERENACMNAHYRIAPMGRQECPWRSAVTLDFALGLVLTAGVSKGKRRYRGPRSALVCPLDPDGTARLGKLPALPTPSVQNIA
jgi:hypothetical protein